MLPCGISVDGDSKMPKLVKKINENVKLIVPGLPPIDISSDVAHVKKNMVKKIYMFKKIYDWTDCEDRGYNINGFTFEYCKLLIDRMFQYAFHSDQVESIEEAKKAIEKCLYHYMPDHPKHSHCYYNRYMWCKTAWNGGNNKSAALNKPLPTGIRKIFRTHLYDEILSDRTISILMKPGCTSLNESCNKIINKYANKKRFLGGLSYAHAVSRGVMQWNDPYSQLEKELSYYGIYLSKAHKQWIKEQIRNNKDISLKSKSHEAHLKNHRKKYTALEACDYVGGGRGIFDCFDALNSEDASDNIHNNDSFNDTC